MVNRGRGIIGAGVLAAAVLAGASFAGTTATATASFVLNQTCSNRIPPNTQASVNATVRNDGNEALVNVIVDGDAGTPGNTADDPTRAHGR